MSPLEQEVTLVPPLLIPPAHLPRSHLGLLMTKRDPTFNETPREQDFPCRPPQDDRGQLLPMPLLPCYHHYFEVWEIKA